MSKIFKNNTASIKTITDVNGLEVPASGQITIDPGYYEALSRSEDAINLLAGGTPDCTYNDGTSDLSLNDALDHIKGGLNGVVVKAQPDPAPFAQPLYITKRDAKTTTDTVAINTNKTIDFKILAESYVSGGMMILKNAELGDYFTAEVNDVDSIIPVEDRAELAENHPTVATYVIKEWVNCFKDAEGISIHLIDTKPLNAKIAVNLYLRIKYFAINAGSQRIVALNYHLTKKL